MVHLCLLAIQLLVHPFHVSVTEIKYKEEKKALQLSSRIFLDDLEVALQNFGSNEKLDITEEANWELVNGLLEKYVLQNMTLSNEKGELQLNYVGAEMEKDVMWVYLEVEKVKKIKKIRFKNSVLTDVFNDQENLVHFRAFEKVKSARLYKGEEEATFEWGE